MVAHAHVTALLQDLSDAPHAPAGYSLDCLLSLRPSVACSNAMSLRCSVSSRGDVVDAILAYDYNGLRAALEDGDAGRPDSDGMTPLHYCVVQGWAEGAALLLLHHPDVRHPKIEHRTPHALIQLRSLP